MTDLEIIKRIRAGNVKAYEELVERYQEKIYAAVCRCVEEKHAIGITEQSLVAAYASLGNIEKESDFAGYLFRSMLTQIKADAAQQKNDAIVAVYDRILQLEYRPRQMLVLRYIMGFSYDEIEQKTGGTREDILTSLADAREKIAGCCGCDAYRTRLQTYLDNEMIRMERMEIEVHAETCSSCADAIEKIRDVFGADVYVQMPCSLVQPVMERVLDEYAQELDEATQERQQNQLFRKIEKNQNLRMWVIVGCVLLFGLFSWLFSLMAGNHLAHVSSSGDQGQMGEVTADAFSAQLAQSIKDADALFVEFGFSRVGVTEQSMILMFADYIALQPAQEYQGMAASNSLGRITTEPSLGYSIVITAEHRLLVDDGEQIWELQTTRDKLLDVLRSLGV